MERKQSARNLLASEFFIKLKNKLGQLSDAHAIKIDAKPLFPTRHGASCSLSRFFKSFNDDPILGPICDWSKLILHSENSEFRHLTATMWESCQIAPRKMSNMGNWSDKKYQNNGGGYDGNAMGSYRNTGGVTGNTGYTMDVSKRCFALHQGNTKFKCEKYSILRFEGGIFLHYFFLP